MQWAPQIVQVVLRVAVAITAGRAPAGGESSVGSGQISGVSGHPVLTYGIEQRRDLEQFFASIRHSSASPFALNSLDRLSFRPRHVLTAGGFDQARQAARADQLQRSGRLMCEAGFELRLIKGHIAILVWVVSRLRITFARHLSAYRRQLAHVLCVQPVSGGEWRAVKLHAIESEDASKLP